MRAGPVHILAASVHQGGEMDERLSFEIAKAREAFCPVEEIEGRLDGGVLVICDHASNAFPPGYGALGLPREALERHIAYDIGAAWMTRRLAEQLGAPAVLSTFSRLLIDPNRGADDPTLVMRISDGAIVPGNARIDAGEVDRRRRLFWSPYRDAIEAKIEAMLATGEPPAIVSLHSFTPIWRGHPRPWKVGVLWDADPRLPTTLLEALTGEGDLSPDEIGDNEPYDGALAGDTIDSSATRRGLSNALIEVRQDLIATQEHAEAWADRLARLIPPLVASSGAREPSDMGSRVVGGMRGPRAIAAA
jgi:predicted N-formylglutamate amidohydrolase